MFQDRFICGVLEGVVSSVSLGQATAVRNATDVPPPAGNRRGAASQRNRRRHAMRIDDSEALDEADVVWFSRGQGDDASGSGAGDEMQEGELAIEHCRFQGKVEKAGTDT